MTDGGASGGTDDPLLGQVLGGYRVQAHIADGAMGAVYQALHLQSGVPVALKILHEDVAQDVVAVERFHREFETADMLDHPHVVKVHQFGETEVAPYMTMELLRGEELGELLRREGRVGDARTVRILAQVAAALEHAHSFGVVHRDLKPDNIFLCRGAGGDDVRLLDFGSVKLQVEMGPKLTAFGTTLGSPYYMSPEQAKGLPDVDQRTDVFALAAILYECLTGAIAFDAKTVAEILMRIVRHPPTPILELRPDLPPGVAHAIERALSKSKATRFASPVAFLEAVMAGFGLRGGLAAWLDRPQSAWDSAFEGARDAAPSLPRPPSSPRGSAAAPPPARPSDLRAPPGSAASPRPATGSMLTSVLVAVGVAGGVVLLGLAIWFAFLR